MKLTDLFLNRFLYRNNSQSLETKDAAFVSADSSQAGPSGVPPGGSAQDINTGNVTIDGAQLTPGTYPVTVLDVSNWGWGQTCAFSSTDLNTVSWGSGTFTSADGTSYAISAGNTGNMAAKTYIYLSLLDSTTVYQITTTPGNSVGVGKVLVAVANPDTTTATYNLSEATQIVGDNILANTINASKITTGQLIVGSNVGQGTARQNFYATPTTPYYLNDLWTAGSTGEIKVCTTQRLTGAYNAADWGLASKYDNTQAQLDLGAEIQYAKANGTTLITGGYISTGILTASNIQTGTLSSILIQTSTSANTGIKMSSAIGGINLYGQNISIRGDTGSAIPGELYGYLGGYSGYFNLQAVSGRNMLIGATDATVFFANDIGTSQAGGGFLGSSGAPWNSIYGGNLVSNNHYEAGETQRLYYSSSKWQSSTDFVANGSFHATGNVYTGGISDNDGSVNCAVVTGATGSLSLDLSGRLQFTTHVDPADGGSYNLGGSARYWGDISYKTLTDRGCLGWFDDGVELQDGTIVSDIEAIQSMKKHPTKKTIYGVPMLDYKSFPKVSYRKAKDHQGNDYERNNKDEPVEVSEYNKKEDKIETFLPADGIEMTSVFSIMIGALKELDNRLKVLEK